MQRGDLVAAGLREFRHRCYVPDMITLPESARAVLESPALGHLVTLEPDGSPTGLRSCGSAIRFESDQVPQRRRLEDSPCRLRKRDHVRNVAAVSKLAQTSSDEISPLHGPLPAPAPLSALVSSAARSGCASCFRFNASAVGQAAQIGPVLGFVSLQAQPSCGVFLCHRATGDVTRQNDGPHLYGRRKPEARQPSRGGPTTDPLARLCLGCTNRSRPLPLNAPLVLG